jgi:hypothetical protein
LVSPKAASLTDLSETTDCQPQQRAYLSTNLIKKAVSPSCPSLFPFDRSQ